MLKVFANAYTHRELIQILARREVQARYRGALMGKIWLFINPLLMLAIYTLVFRFIFKAKWPNAPDADFVFAQLLFVGLIIHSFAAEVFSRSTNLILSNVNYVKKITFPLEILSWIVLESALVHALVSFLILCLFLILSSFVISATWLLLPVIILPFCLFLTGMSWYIAVLGVYFRDLDQIVGLLITALLFLSPVFYSVESAPAALQPYLRLNPLTTVIEQCRDVLIFAQLPDLYNLLLYYLFALLVFVSGFYFFEKLRRGFADVI
jgi:lipopolysaccharide transport system permease protein